MIAASEIAARLVDAERAHASITPFSDEHPDLDIDTAYAAQSAFVHAKLASGQRLVGAKVGLVSKAKQQVMNVDQPIFGLVTSDMLLQSGELLNRADFIAPRVEPEIGFLLSRDLKPPATVASVLAATEVVFGALDVLDSRFEDYRFTAPDVIADNASSGRMLIGPEARSPRDLVDLRLVGCVLRVNGDIVATAAGAAVMSHPAQAVAWLANSLEARGHRLSAGQLVFSGGLTAPVSIDPSVAVTAEFDGLGAVEIAMR